MNTTEREFQNLYRGPPCFRNGFILRLEHALSRGKLVDLEGLEFPLYGHTWVQEMIVPKLNRGFGSRVLRCQHIINLLQNAGILSLEQSGSFRVVHSPVVVEPDVEPDVDIQSQECTICMLQKSEFHSCTQCVHSWCSDCQSHMHRCPYCREPFHRIDQVQVRAVPTEEQVQQVMNDLLRFLQVQ